MVAYAYSQHICNLAVLHDRRKCAPQQQQLALQQRLRVPRCGDEMHGRGGSGSGRRRAARLRRLLAAAQPDAKDGGAGLPGASGAFPGGFQRLPAAALRDLAPPGPRGRRPGRRRQARRLRATAYPRR